MAAPSPSEIQYQLSHIDEDRSSDIVISHIICMTLAGVAVVLRFVSRYLCKAAVKADDYMIIAALVFAAGEVTGGLLCVQHGGGKHAILIKEPVTFGELVLITEMFMPAAIASVKISILLLYLRIFPGPRFRQIVWAVGCFVMCCCITQTFLIMFQCRPVQAAWNIHVKGDCLPLSLTYVVLGSLNALTDIIALCLPMPLLWRLKTDRTRKLQLIGTFGLGTLICVVSLYRIPKMAHISLSDASWSDVEPCVWAVVEACVAIFCACLPTFPALFRIKSVRDYRRPSGDRRHVPSSTADQRESRHRGDSGDTRQGILKTTEWETRSSFEEKETTSHTRESSQSV